MIAARVILHTRFGESGQVLNKLYYPLRNLLACCALLGLLAACKPVTRPPDVIQPALSPGLGDDARAIPPITAVKVPTFSDRMQQEVMEAQQEFTYAADFVHDVPTAQTMLADDYHDSNGNNKERKLAGIEFGRRRATESDFSQVEIAVDGDRATISYVLTTTEYEIGQSESTVTDTYTCINTWTKRDGQWQLVTAKC